jgi:DeoR family glycerol-3-phosphate regulon repressor
MEAVAEGLLSHEGLTVITNHIGVALILSQNPDFTILIPGGQLRSRDKAITGDSALEFLNKNRVAYGIFGIGSITDEGHLLDYDYRDAQLSRHAMEVCSIKFVAADHSKFNSEAMMPISHVSEINTFFTDKMPPQSIVNSLRENDTSLFVGSAKI